MRALSIFVGEIRILGFSTYRDFTNWSNCSHYIVIKYMKFALFWMNVCLGWTNGIDSCTPTI